MTKLDMSIPSHKHPLHRLQLFVIICIRIIFFWKELEFLNHLQLSFWQSLWSISLQNYEKGRHNLRALASTITVELYPFVESNCYFMSFMMAHVIDSYNISIERIFIYVWSTTCFLYQFPQYSGKNGSSSLTQKLTNRYPRSSYQTLCKLFVALLVCSVQICTFVQKIQFLSCTKYTSKEIVFLEIELTKLQPNHTIWN
jgi:hypothetical protein